MNIDFINKIEKFVLVRLEEERIVPIKDYLIIAAVFFGVVAIILFALSYSDFSRIESTNISHSYLMILAVLIPIVSTLSIIRAKNRIRKAIYKEGIRGSIFITLASRYSRIAIEGSFSPNAALTVSVVVWTAFGLGLIYGASARLYKVYLMRKYAPYFKDERLRRDK